METLQNTGHMQNQSPAVLAAKLQPRLSSPSLLPRPRVIEHIHGTSSARLVLVHAPAGFGKTTIMTEYYAQMRQRGAATAWLTVDTADNDVSRFLAYLVGAFRIIDPLIGQALLDCGIARADDGVHNVALDLANQLSMHDRPFMLFIDDFEAIQNPTIFELLRRIVDYLPVHGQLVIGSRNVPDLGLGRLRAHGQLLEVDASELRFTHEETASFLRQRLDVALSDQHIRWLQKHTDGWVAALWLASLALKGRDNPQQFIETFNGSNAMIMDYLLDDVLAGQPDPVRSFLLQTGVLNDLSAPLCDWITGRTDSREMLAYIERANLFLVPQDPERRWYRYHKLFSDFLRTHLKRVTPDASTALHRSASVWYLAEGRPVPAIEHALQSKDFDHALALLATHAESLLWQGRVRLLARWFDACLPDVRLQALPNLLLIYAWALTFTHRYQDATAQLERLRNSRIEGGIDDATWAQVNAIQAFILALTDQVEEAVERWQGLLGILTPKDAFAYNIFITSYAFCLVAASRFKEARKFLDQGRQFYMDAGSVLNTTMAMCIEGSIDLVQGRLRGAVSRYRAALAGVATDRARQVSGTSVASAYLGEALYEANELDEAEKLLTAFLPLLKELAAPDQLITSYVILARIASFRDNADRMADLLTEMEYLGHQQALPRLVANARLERARFALRQGDINVARDHLESASEADTWHRFKGFVMLANDVETPELFGYRIRIRSGHGESIITELKQMLKRAEELQRYRPILKLKILLAEALHGAGQENIAMRHLKDALEFASAEGFIRTFLDEGTPVLRLVADFKKNTKEEGGDPKAQHAVMDFVDRILSLGGYVAVQTAAAAADIGCARVEELSDRERQVLALLGKGYQNRVIAEKLFVSETTIKAHLRNINAKLGTRNRTHAIAVARNLGLVH